MPNRGNQYSQINHQFATPPKYPPLHKVVFTSNQFQIPISNTIVMKAPPILS
jgi:hypothetical protein